MKQKVLMLSATGYSMTSADTKELLEGISCYYYPHDNLNNIINDSNGLINRGGKPAKESFPLSYFSKIVAVPGFYEFDFELKVNAANKQVLVASDLNFIAPVELIELKLVEKFEDKKSK